MKNWIRTQVEKLRLMWHYEMGRVYWIGYNKNMLSIDEAYNLIMSHLGKMLKAAENLTEQLNYCLNQETMDAIEQYKELYETYKLDERSSC